MEVFIYLSSVLPIYPISQTFFSISCPFLSSTSKKTYPNLSIVFCKSWNRTKKLRKAGGLPECHEIYHCYSKAKGNYPWLSRDAQQDYTGKWEERDVWSQAINRFPWYKISPLDFTVLIPKFCKIPQTFVSAIPEGGDCVNVIYAMFLHYKRKNETALIPLKIQHFCAALFWSGEQYCIF